MYKWNKRPFLGYSKKAQGDFLERNLGKWAERFAVDLKTQEVRRWLQYAAMMARFIESDIKYLNRD